MSFEIKYTPAFEKEFERLAKKYPLLYLASIYDKAEQGTINTAVLLKKLKEIID